MKLLNAAACCSAVAGGNVKRTTVMGDAARDRLSDAGSIPARSTKMKQAEFLIECDVYRDSACFLRGEFCYYLGCYFAI